MQRRHLNIAAMAAALPTLVLRARAQPTGDKARWPSRPVRILVGFPAGSSPDTLARMLADPLSKALGQPFIVENKAGANGLIALEQLARSTDDHTLGIVGNNLVSARLLSARFPFDPAKDFCPISLLATSPLVLVATRNAPEGAAFFAAAAQKGDQWFYGSVGNGSMGHLAMELLKTRVKGFAPTHVPFKGNPDVVTSIVSGEIQMALVPPGVAMPQVRAGKLKAIGLAGGRSALAPEVASLSEAGVRNFTVEVWAALAGPANLSRAAQDRLAVEVPKAARQAEVRQGLLNQGWQVVGTSPDGLRNRIADEAAVVGAITAARAIKLE